MAIVTTDDNNYKNIAAAIRNKTGTTDVYTPEQMPAAIQSIQGGGGDNEKLKELLSFSGNCSYLFRNDQWNSFISEYKDLMSFNLVSALENCFTEMRNLVSLEGVVFNCATTFSNFSNMFSDCNKLTILPKIIQKDNGSTNQFNNTRVFQYCSMLKEIPDDFLTLENDHIYVPSSYYSSSYGLNGCYSLRKVSKKLIKWLGFPFIGGSQNLYVLDELWIPLPPEEYSMARNYSFGFGYFYRLKHLVFETNEDGTAKKAKLANINLDLRSSIGCSTNGKNGSYDTYITGYNSGITTDKKVYNAETYQALKNDPDWYTAGYTFDQITDAEIRGYSRYDHDSAVETINSLPDTSEFLATNGGTNTITFRGDLGGLTDAGAINTLTEEEIAVATAKGWTVSIV